MRYENIVVLTGAGVSAESGVRTFRDNDGLWEEHRVEQVATPEAFAHDPDLVQRFYNTRRAQLHMVEPNAAHHALARLENELRGEVTIVTQNVDDLHERAGSRNIIHMHGEIRKIRCIHCHHIEAWEDDCTQQTPCPACGQAPAMRPNVVWFGETPFDMHLIQDKLIRCDLFASIGTSGHVYPAAGFVAEVRELEQAHTIEINLEPSAGVGLFEEHRHGPAGELVPELVDELLGVDED